MTMQCKLGTAVLRLLVYQSRQKSIRYQSVVSIHEIYADYSANKSILEKGITEQIVN